MEFASLADLAGHLASGAVAELRGAQHGLKRAAEIIEATARAEIGEYQKEIGPFAAWEQLSPATEADKAAHGYRLDAPLERTGEMRDSMRHEVHPGEAIIGSTDPTMVYHEFGTSKMSARAVLGPALFRNIEKVQQLVGHAAAAGMVGEDPIHPSLGYDITT